MRDFGEGFQDLFSDIRNASIVDVELIKFKKYSQARDFVRSHGSALITRNDNTEQFIVKPDGSKYLRVNEYEVKELQQGNFERVKFSLHIPFPSPDIDYTKEKEWECPPLPKINYEVVYEYFKGDEFETTGIYLEPPSVSYISKILKLSGHRLYPVNKAVCLLMYENGWSCDAAFITEDGFTQFIGLGVHDWYKKIFYYQGT